MPTNPADDDPMDEFWHYEIEKCIVEFLDDGFHVVIERQLRLDRGRGVFAREAGMKTFIPFTPEQLKELSDLGTIVTLGQMTVKSQEKELVKSRRKLAKISRLHSQKFNSFKRINRELAKARSGK